MDLINPLLLIVAGILAISGLIVAKKPNAKELIDKLVPYQAFIGVALLAFGLWNLVRSLGSVFQILKFAPLLGITALGVIFSSVLLGFMFGMPQIAKWIPGESSAEAKAVELSKKVAPIQMIIGMIAIAAGALALLIELGILKPSF